MVSVEGKAALTDFLLHNAGLTPNTTLDKNAAVYSGKDQSTFNFS